MKLDRLSIENFRQYYGAQTVIFARDPAKNITIFNGQNGAGKTALFTSLSWCLYGEAVLAPDQLVSKRAISEAQPGDRVTARVTLGFIHNGERFLARREVTGVRLRDEAKLRYEGHSTFMLMRIRPDGQSRPVDNPTGTLNAILPENVRTYFFFDGEKIDEFARPDHEDEVKHAVRNVLDIEILDRAKTHLDAVARDLRSELKSSSTGELQTLLDTDEARRQELDKIDRDLNLKQAEHRAAKKQLESLDQRLSEITAVRDFTSQRATLTRELQHAEQRRDELRQSLRDGVNRAAAVFAVDALRRALAVLDEKREKGEIPPGIRQQFLQDLLEAMVCICGRQISSGSAEHEHLTVLLKKTFPSDLEDLVLQSGGEVRNVLRRASEGPEQIRTLLEKKVALDGHISKLDAQLDEISRQLSAFNVEEVADLEKKRSDYAFSLQQIEMDIHRLKGRTEQINLDLERLGKQIEAAKKSEKKAQSITRRFVLAQQSADAIAKIAEIFASQMRQQIREQAQKIFQTLIWKTAHFKQIRLTDDYSLDVIDRYGLPARPDLSAGERQVLSLAFITAMAKVSGKEAPLVMDTPFGRLSGEHRANITEHIPELSDQLVLFVTDEELREHARKNLQHRIGAEYGLEFDQKTSCTMIAEAKR
jgi:DNA sulfur modification protein DndD